MEARAAGLIRRRLWIDVVGSPPHEAHYVAESLCRARCVSLAFIPFIVLIYAVQNVVGVRDYRAAADLFCGSPTALPMLILVLYLLQLIHMVTIVAWPGRLMRMG